MSHLTNECLLFNSAMMVGRHLFRLHYLFFFLFSLIIGGFWGALKYIMCLLLLLCSLGMSEEKKIVQRLNYGVVFKEQGQLVLSNEHWLHTFEINMPDHVAIPSLGTCHKDNSTCLLIAHILASINAVRSETSARLNNTIETIRKLIPEAEIKRSRSRRSLLPFIGDLSKSLFGTATVEDVNVLARHINALTKRTRAMATVLAQHEDGLSSYITKANHRMDNLMKGIKDNYMALYYRQSQIKDTTRELEEHFQSMIALLSQQIQSSSHINHELDELKIGITDLVNGKLSPLLLPQPILSSTINNIQNILNNKYPGFYLNQASPASIYSDSNFLYSRNKTSVYITIKIPISHFQEPLHVFNVLSLPVPVNATSKHATHLLNLPDNLILTSNQQFYTTISDLQLNKCKGKSVKQCAFNLALTPVTTESCILALYINSKSKVQSLCDFRFVHNVLHSKIIELTPNFLVLYHTPLISMECGKEHKMIKGCDFCIVNLPCQCTIITTEFYLAPRLASCHNHTKDISMLHPVNLILLQHFFENNHIDNVFADTSFSNPINITIPKFKFYKHEMSDIMADDQKSHLSLAKMADSAKKNETIFQSLAEPLLDGEIAIQTDWPDLNAILIFVSMGTTVASIIIMAWTCLKLRKLSQAVLVLQQCKAINSLPSTLPSFVYKSEETQVIEDNNILKALEITWEHAIFALALITMILVILLIYIRKQKADATTLCLEVTNTQQCIFIDIAKLPLCPSHCTVEAPTSITEIEVEGSCLVPKLKIFWDGCKIIDNMTHRITEVPSVQRLNFFAARKLQSVIRRPFFVYLHSKHATMMTPVHYAS